MWPAINEVIFATRLILHVFNERPGGRTPGFISQFSLEQIPYHCNQSFASGVFNLQESPLKIML